MTTLVPDPPARTRITSKFGSVVVFRVADHEMQQKILHAFTTIERPSLHALGTQNAHEWFVLVECSDAGGLVSARRVVCTMDPKAVEVPHAAPHGGLLRG